MIPSLSTFRPFFAALLVLSVAAGGRALAEPALASGETPHAGEHDVDEETGSHGGLVVRDGTLAVEIVIFEAGVAPQWRAWVTADDSPVPPDQVDLRLEATRLGQPAESFLFEPRGDFLLGDHPVDEPHAFTVVVTAAWKERRLRGTFEMGEARVTMPDDVASAGGVGTMVAGPGSLDRTLRLTGRIGVPTDRLVAVRPRFPGVVRFAQGRIGDRVEAGERLAEVESSGTLSRFVVESPLSGSILDRRAVAGSTVDGEDALYVVADLGEVWADLDVYGDDTSVVRVGETVTVRADDRLAGDASVAPVEDSAPVSYVSPLRDVHTQTMLARVVLPNRDGRWAPGEFVSAVLHIAEPPASVTVPVTALQAWRGREAVFVRVGDVFEARPVRIGRRGEEKVEVLDGVDAGSTVATGNTFLLRAEIEKAGASHDH